MGFEIDTFFSPVQLSSITQTFYHLSKCQIHYLSIPPKHSETPISWRRDWISTRSKPGEQKCHNLFIFIPRSFLQLHMTPWIYQENNKRIRSKLCNHITKIFILGHKKRVLQMTMNRSQMKKYSWVHNYLPWVLWELMT